MKLQKLLLWGAGITGSLFLIDNMRIKKWITLPITASNVVIPIPQGRIDFKFDSSKIKVDGEPGQYRVVFPVLDIIDKEPSPHTILQYQSPPIKLPSEIVSKLSIMRITWALRNVRVEVIQMNNKPYLKINIPPDVRVPIYW